MKYKKQLDRIIYDVKRGEHPHVICPKCGYGDMEYQRFGWQCLWRDCMFQTDELPSEDEIQKLINLKENIRLIRKYKI